MEELSKLERGHVSLQDGRHLLQTDDRQLVSGAQRVLVFVLVGAAMGLQAGPTYLIAGMNTISDHLCCEKSQGKKSVTLPEAPNE